MGTQLLLLLVQESLLEAINTLAHSLCKHVVTVGHGGACGSVGGEPSSPLPPHWQRDQDQMKPASGFVAFACGWP
jgi:hypothetical protein